MTQLILIIFSFYACWCGRCKKFRPLWNELDKKYQNEQAISICRVDCAAEQENQLCFDQKVDGYPTVVLYKDGVWWKEYEGGRNLPELIDFLESHKSEEGIKEWEIRDLQREIAHQLKIAERAARKAQAL